MQLFLGCVQKQRAWLPRKHYDARGDEPRKVRSNDSVAIKIKGGKETNNIDNNPEITSTHTLERLVNLQEVRTIQSPFYPSVECLMSC